MKDKLNCPNCGAPITSSKCEYCGTVFHDFTNFNLYGKNIIRFNCNGKVIEAEVYSAMTEMIWETDGFPRMRMEFMVIDQKEI